MPVWKLVLKLLFMPITAKVKHIWDGEPRTAINHIWLSHQGEVMTADNEEIVYTSRHWPENINRDREKIWRTSEK